MTHLLRTTVFLVMMSMLTVQAETQRNTIHIVSDLWPGATLEDGSGLYWELVKQAFALEAINVTTAHMPYARSVEQVVHGNADAWLASYPDEVQEAVYSKHHIDIDEILAISDCDMPLHSQDDLRNRTLAWLRGYRFDRYLNVPVDIHEVDSQEHALKMLLSGHGLNAYLTPATLYEPSIQASTFIDAELKVTPLMQLPLLVGFRNTQRGIRMRDAFDRGFAQLLQQGEVARLYQRYNWGLYQPQVPDDSIRLAKPSDTHPAH